MPLQVYLNGKFGDSHQQTQTFPYHAPPLEVPHLRLMPGSGKEMELFGMVGQSQDGLQGTEVHEAAQPRRIQGGVAVQFRHG